MKWTNALAVLSVAALAFAAGQALPLSGTAAAQPPAKEAAKPAQPPKEGAPAGMPDMDAMLASMKPGAEHKVLDQFVGDWVGEVKFWMAAGEEPMTSKGTIHREWALDGRFVKEDVTGEMPGMEGQFKGLSYMGYNTIEKRYETVWLENMATHISMSTGSWDAAKKVLTITGDQLNPMTQKREKTRMTVDLSNPGTEVMIGYCTPADGKEFKNFEGRFEKKK